MSRQPAWRPRQVATTFMSRLMTRPVAQAVLMLEEGGGSGNRIRIELILQQGDVARLSARSDGDDRRIRRPASLLESTGVHGIRPVSWRHPGDGNAAADGRTR
jgi:hypothetical protein